MADKIKVLALCDYGCSTGFGQVASNIMTRLNDTGLYDITVIGINYDPANNIDFKRWPGRIIPAITVSDMNAPDVYGRQKLLNELGTGEYDILFIIQDTFIVQTIIEQINETQQALEHKFATIHYYPIDATPKREWIEGCVAHIDFPVPYTDYARDETLKIMPELEDHLVKPIYHGTNLDDFNYIEDRKSVAEFRKKYFGGVADGRFLMTNVNRNQPRKDIARNFMIMKELKRRGLKDPILYLHMAHDDSGGNLLVMAEEFGLKLREDFMLPTPKVFTVNQGLPIEYINLIYNASDMVLSTTLGEGWGLSITEAMATKTPLVVPANTSLIEMCADDRAFTVASGKGSHWFNLGAPDNERMRPLMSVKEAADRIESILDGNKPDIQGAYEWARKYSWDYVCEDWKRVFADAAAYAKHLTEDAKPKLNREQRRKLERKKK